MSTRKSSITAELKLSGASKFKSDLKDVGREARVFGSDIGKAGSKFGNLSGGGNFSNMKRGISEVGKSYNGLFQLILDSKRLIESPLKANAAYQDLKDQLTAVEGSSESASESLGFLRRVARDQAMEFEPLVTAQKRLVSLGYSAEESRDMIRELANAAEFSGEGVEAVDAIVGSLTNVSEKGEASLKALMRLGDAMPALRKLIGEEFGARSAKELEGLDLTSRELFDGLSRGLKKLQTAKASASESALDQNTDLILGADEEAANLPERKQSSEEEETRVKRVEELQNRSANRKATAAEVELAKQTKIAELEAELAGAEAAADHAAADALTEELALLSDKADLMEKMGATDAAAEAFLRRKVELEREVLTNARRAAEVAEAKEKSGELTKSQSRNNRDLATLEAEAGGMSSRKLKELRHSGKLADEQERLEGEGYSAKDAKAMAERKVGAEDRITENEERASRGLRPRIRTMGADESQQRRISRMSEGDRAKLEDLNHNESAEQTFQRKERGGLSAHGGDDSMDVRNRRFKGLDELKAMQPGSRKRGLGVSGDDPMATRRRDGLSDRESMQPGSDPQARPALPAQEREPIRGARAKRPEGGVETSNSAAADVKGGFAAVIRALDGVKQTLEKIGPNAAMRARPTNI